MSVIKPSATVQATQEFVKQSSPPAPPTSDKTKIYSKTDGNLYLQNSDGVETPVGSGSTVGRITQGAHGFIVGNVLRKSGASFVKSNASDAASAEVACMVSRVIDSGTFEYVTNGIVKGLVAACFSEGTLPAQDAQCFLSTTDGKLTITEPTVVGQISKPVFLVTKNNTTDVDGVFVNMRGSVIGGANLYTSITVANSGTTTFHTIQGLAGTGGWLSGTIKLDGSSTKYTIPFLCYFSRQLDGTTYNVSPQYGDTIPSGLSISNSGSAIQITVPSGSFTSCVVTYAVQAAANGTTLPVSVSASSVVGSTSGSAPAAGVIGQKTISASLSKTPSTTAVWEVATGNFGTPSAGVYLLVTTLQANGAASLTGVGAIINENGSSVTPVLSQTQGVASSVIGPITSKVQHYVTDGTKTLYGWAICYGATINVTITCELIRIG